MREYAMHQAQQSDSLPHQGVLVMLWRKVSRFWLNYPPSKRSPH